MLTLILLRHAKSSWDDPGLDDFDRPLAKRGRKAAPEVGSALARMGLRPDLVLCSTAVRTRQTLEIVLDELGPPAPRVIFDERLYMATSDRLIKRLHAVGADETGALPSTVMMVGHNPGLEELAIRLVGRGAAEDTARMSAKFPTAAVAVIAFDGDDWTALAPGEGRLEHFLTPKRLA